VSVRWEAALAIQTVLTGLGPLLVRRLLTPRGGARGTAEEHATLHALALAASVLAGGLSDLRSAGADPNLAGVARHAGAAAIGVYDLGDRVGFQPVSDGAAAGHRSHTGETSAWSACTRTPTPARSGTASSPRSSRASGRSARW